MRIYTRGENQCLLIDHEITVTVLGVYSDHVRLGIHSPQNDPPYLETDLYLSDGTSAEASLELIELELTPH